MNEFSKNQKPSEVLQREQITCLALYLVNILFDCAGVGTVRNIRLKHRIACNGVKYMMLEKSLIIDAWKIHNNKS